MFYLFRSPRKKSQRVNYKRTTAQRSHYHKRFFFVFLNIKIALNRKCKNIFQKFVHLCFRDPLRLLTREKNVLFFFHTDFLLKFCLVKKKQKKNPKRTPEIRSRESNFLSNTRQVTQARNLWRIPYFTFFVCVSAYAFRFFFFFLVAIYT